MGKHVVVSRSEWQLTKDIRLWEDMQNVELPTSMYSTWNHTPPTSFVYTMPMWPMKNVVVIMRWKPAGSSGNARVLPEHLRAEQDDDSEDDDSTGQDLGGGTQTAVGTRIQRAVWTTPGEVPEGAATSSSPSAAPAEKPWCLATLNLEEATAIRRAMHLRNPFMIDARDVTRDGATLHAAVVQLWTTDGRLLDERTDDPRHSQGEFIEQMATTSVRASSTDAAAVLAGGDSARVPAAASAVPPLAIGAGEAATGGGGGASSPDDDETMRVVSVSRPGSVVGLTKVDKWELPTQAARYFDLQVAYNEM